MGMTVNRARCHNHKFDPIGQKDYYSLAAAVNGWVETDWPLVASRTEAEAYLKKNKDVDAKVDAVRDKISAIEKPYRSTGKSWQLDIGEDAEGREALDLAIVDAFRAELGESGADPRNRFIRLAPA